MKKYAKYVRKEEKMFIFCQVFDLPCESIHKSALLCVILYGLYRKMNQTITN